MRVFGVLFLAVFGVGANPLLLHKDLKQEQETANSRPEVDHYDQRQNGTENYRFAVDGLVFILAPAESLLLAGAALEPNFTSLMSEMKPKPKPDSDITKPKPEKDNGHKAVHHDSLHGTKHGLRISNLIGPFLNRIRHSQPQIAPMT